MVIRYPNGKSYQPVTKQPTKKTPKKEIIFGNRGKSLEDDLNDTNTFYLNQQIAVIHKKPVPVQIVKVEYPSRSAAVIREAYFRTPSTTDYNGVWQGHYVDFEAKETKNKTSFPMQNIHEHQMSHLQGVVAQQGIAFFIVRFTTLERDFLVFYAQLLPFWQAMKKGGRKSIPLAFFEKEAAEIALGYTPRLDYLRTLQASLESEENPL